MANTIIKLEADATGWHANLRCEAPELPDGWAVVPEGEVAVLADCGGVVTFATETAAAADYPAVLDRRTADRGGPYPVAVGLTGGTYVPPAPPEPQPEPEPSLDEQVDELQEALHMILEGTTE